VCSNVCLLSAPLLFCFVLLAIQLMVNRLILVGPDYEVSSSSRFLWCCCCCWCCWLLQPMMQQLVHNEAATAAGCK
jgi:hypothetical protein